MNLIFINYSYDAYKIYKSYFQTIYSCLSVYIRITMQSFVDRLAIIRDKINSSDSICPREDYGIVCYFCGLLSFKNDSIDDLFTFYDSLQYLKSNSYIDDSLYKHFLNLSYQTPHKICEMTLILEKMIHNEPIEIYQELDRIAKENKESENSGNSKTIQKNDTVQIQDDQLNVDGARIQQNQNEQFLKKIEFTDKQSEALARKLQAEQEELAKKFNNVDDAVCQICYVGLYEQQFLPLENCQHIFHIGCLSQAFKAQISQNNFPLKCPNDTCKQREIKDSDIKQILNEEIYEKYQSHTLKFYADMHGDSISWCPTADCKYMFFFEKDDFRFHCGECRKQYCLNCRAEWHQGMTCKQFQVTNTHSSEDDKFLSFVKGKKFKQCPKCKFWVQKNKGCDHMTCKCKFQFCYKCGGVFMKCECIEKAKELHQRRRQLQEQRMRKKAERLLKKAQQDKVGEGRPTRSKRKRNN